jgi:tyrosinase
MMMSRRMALFSGASLALLPVTPLFADALPQRSRVYGTTAPASISSYKRAVAAMLALPPDNPHNWYRQAMIHIIDCPHANWWFLLWHRGYLANFEKICAKYSGDPNFKLPYWDWTESATVPDVFFDSELDPGSATFYSSWNQFEKNLGPAIANWWSALSPGQKTQAQANGFNSGADVMARAQMHFNYSNGARTPTRSQPALSADAAGVVVESFMTSVMSTNLGFEDFASSRVPQTGHNTQHSQEGTLESGPHDNVHGATGGYMGAFLSPVDPVFWLHHANLDRIWWLWARAKGDAALPTGADLVTLKAEPFVFFVDENANPAPSTAGDYLDASALGYVYERGSLDNGPPAIAALSSFTARTLAQQTTISKGLRARLETAEVLAVLPTDIENAVRATGPAELVARIKINPPEHPFGFHVRVFVNCPYLSQGTPVNDPHFVGSISFFAALHSPNMPMASTFSVPLGPALRRLGAAGKLPRSQIKVQLIPVGPGGVTAPAGTLQGVSIDVH